MLSFAIAEYPAIKKPNQAAKTGYGWTSNAIVNKLIMKVKKRFFFLKNGMVRKFRLILKLLIPDDIVGIISIAFKSCLDFLSIHFLKDLLGI